MTGPDHVVLAGRRRPVGATTDDLVTFSGDDTLPARARPAVPGVDLARWLAGHADPVRRRLQRCGALLFRGFDVDLRRFSAVAAAVLGRPAAYRERSSPRTALAEGVYTSTAHPADQDIALHNENSYQRELPGVVLFACLEPAATGGATRLADVRRVLDRLDPDVVAEFRARGVRYVRNFHPGLGLSWSEVFGTDDRAAVERYCGEHDIVAEWMGPDRLRTTQRRPAVARHPGDARPSWCNHALFFNPRALAPSLASALVAQFEPLDQPTNTFFGDGAVIDDATLAHLAGAYAAEQVDVPWARGDLLLVDNVAVAHGRERFTGPRQVLVAMGAGVSWSTLAGAGS